MATREPKFTIPSAFIRLDDSITGADEFVNGRDLQVWRNNHNKLIANGLKRHLCTFLCGRVQGSTKNSETFTGTKKLSRSNADLIFAVPLKLSPLTKELEVVIQGFRRNASAACTVFFCVDTVSKGGVLNETTADMTITSTTGAKHSATVPVPHEAAEEGICILSAYLQGIVYGADLLNPGGTSAAIVSVGTRIIRIDTTAAGAAVPASFDAVYVNTLNYAPKEIIRVRSIGLNVYDLYMAESFEGPIEPGTDTAETRACTGISLQSVSIYEKRIADFADNPGEI